MDPHLTFSNVSCEDFLENMNHSNYPVVFKDKTRLLGNEKELSEELISQFNQCQVKWTYNTNLLDKSTIIVEI